MPTLAKVRLSDAQNEAVEQYKRENDCTKPEAVNALLDARLKHLKLLDYDE